MNEYTIDGVVFKTLPRGTRRGFLMPLEIDVWPEGSGQYNALPGVKWRFTLTHGSNQHGRGHATGFNSFESAAQAAVVMARNIIHPISTPAVTTWLCTVCGNNPVDPEQGFDTCKSCNP